MEAACGDLWYVYFGISDLKYLIDVCAKLVFISVACRSLHTTPASNAPLPTSSTSPETPMTHIAKLGSNQLSLETPQNKVGELVRSRWFCCVLWVIDVEYLFVFGW